jgi:hypothetical protein
MVAFGSRSNSRVSSRNSLSMSRAGVASSMMTMLGSSISSRAKLYGQNGD